MFLKYDHTWFICLLVSVFFGVLGFMDDYIKIKYKQNLGLRAYQKIIGQVGISLIFAFFVYFSTNGGNIFLPFSEKVIDIGFWVIPLIVLTLVATTNSVNLTDGLDGLAGNSVNIYLIFFFLIISILQNKLYVLGETGQIIQNFENKKGIFLNMPFKNHILNSYFIAFASLILSEISFCFLSNF